MKFSHLLLVVILCVAATLAADRYFRPSAQTSTEESVYQRVQQSGTIRCGYIVFAPYLFKDANTGQMSGISYDFVTALAEELGLKVDWVEEVSWGNFHEGLNSARYDLMCTPVWQSGARAKVALLTKPLYYNAMYAYARADDKRFDGNLDAANDPNVRVAVMDGDITKAVRGMLLPKSQELAVPEYAPYAQALLSVATKKADLLFDNPDDIERFNKNSADKLKRVGDSKPIRIFGNSLAVKQGEHEFKAMLDAALEAVYNANTGYRIVKKYNQIFLPAQPGYVVGAP